MSNEEHAGAVPRDGTAAASRPRSGFPLPDPHDLQTLAMLDGRSFMILWPGGVLDGQIGVCRDVAHVRQRTWLRLKVAGVGCAWFPPGWYRPYGWEPRR
jgi:hypothetical protein